MRNASTSLFPDFIGGGAIVGLPVRRIAVLIGVKIFVRLGCDYLLYAANRTVRTFITRSNNHLRAEGGQDSLALVRSAVWQTERDGIADGGADHGVCNAGIAAS